MRSSLRFINSTPIKASHEWASGHYERNKHNEGSHRFALVHLLERAVFAMAFILGFGLFDFGGANVAGRALAQECRVLNVPKLEPKAASDRTWEGDRHWANRSRGGIAWFGRFNKNENYVELRTMYDADGLTVYVNVADLYLWWTLDNGVQWGGKLVGEIEKGDAIELMIEPVAATGDNPGPSESARRFVVASYPYWDAKTTGSPHLATRTWKGDGSSWSEVADPATAGLLWYHAVSYSWNADPGPNNNKTEFDNGTNYSFFIPWKTLGLSAEPKSGSVMRVAARLYDVDDPKDTDFPSSKPSENGSKQVGPLPPTLWPESADADHPNSWAAAVLNQAPYKAPTVVSEQTVTVAPADVPMHDVTVGGHSFIKQRWLDGGGTESNYGWDTCMNTRFSAGNNAFDLIIHPEAGPTHLCFFARTLVSYDLSSKVPKGSAVVSATLRMYHDGGDWASPDDPADFAAQDSPVQVHRLEKAWLDSPLDQTVTWNTAPLAAENVGFGRVAVEGSKDIEFDVTPLVARAVLRGEPVNMALYGADTNPNSGKYFVASEGSAEGGPRLTIVYGTPSNPAEMPDAESCTIGVAKALFPKEGTGSPGKLLSNTSPIESATANPNSGGSSVKDSGCSVSALPTNSGLPSLLVLVVPALFVWRRHSRGRSARRAYRANARANPNGT